MFIIAHRGASAYYKENTIKAFKAAQEMGSVFFETDVQLSKDGVLVLFHDYHFINATGNKQFIKDTVFSGLSQYDIPSLASLFEVLSETAFINLEIKNDDNLYPGIEEKLINFIKLNKNSNPQRLLISSFDYPSLQRVRALDKDIKIGVLTRSFDINAALSLNAYSININAARLTKEIVEQSHKNNIKVLVYTVNDKKQALEMQKIGVDGIFTDYPDILKN